MNKNEEQMYRNDPEKNTDLHLTQAQCPVGSLELLCGLAFAGHQKIRTPRGLPWAQSYHQKTTHLGGQK